ncbi:MAG: nuclear transport factor 2 family protein [Bacteroidales bacterium]
MDRKITVIEMYKKVDQADPEGVASYLTDDAIFRFANIPAVQGKENIITFLKVFYEQIKRISHYDFEFFEAKEALIANGIVKYTRLNGTELEVPFSVTLKFKNDKIQEYLIFVDNSELFI